MSRDLTCGGAFFCFLCSDQSYSLQAFFLRAYWNGLRIFLNANAFTGCAFHPAMEGWWLRCPVSRSHRPMDFVVCMCDPPFCRAKIVSADELHRVIVRTVSAFFFSYGSQSAPPSSSRLQSLTLPHAIWRVPWPSAYDPAHRSVRRM
jgi:hypothetical protein